MKTRYYILSFIILTICYIVTINFTDTLPDLWFLFLIPLFFVWCFVSIVLFCRFILWITGTKSKDWTTGGIPRSDDVF